MIRNIARPVASAAIWVATALAFTGAAVSVGLLLWMVRPTDQTLVHEAGGIVQRALGEDPDRWQHFVYNYQTLIGGGLAVWAALITVVAMIFVDSRQAIRHDQLVALNLRQDRLRLERLIVPQLGRLQGCHFTLQANHRSGQLASVRTEQTFFALQRVANTYANVLLVIAECTNCDAWKSSVDLFDGNLTNDCVRLKACVDTVSAELYRMNNLIEHISYFEMPGRRVGPGDAASAFTTTHRAGLTNLIADFGVTAVNLQIALGDVVKRLTELSVTYGIDLKKEHWIMPSPNQS